MSQSPIINLIIRKQDGLAHPYPLARRKTCLSSYVDHLIYVAVGSNGLHHLNAKLLTWSRFRVDFLKLIPRSSVCELLYWWQTGMRVIQQEQHCTDPVILKMMVPIYWVVCMHKYSSKVTVDYMTILFHGHKRNLATIWLGGVVVRALDSWSRGRGFDSDRGTIRATTLSKLFTPNVPLFTKQYNLVPCEGFHANAP